MWPDGHPNTVLVKLLGYIMEAKRRLSSQVKDRETRPVAETRRFRAPQRPSAQIRRDSAPPCTVLPRDLSCAAAPPRFLAWLPVSPPPVGSQTERFAPPRLSQSHERASTIILHRPALV